MRTFALKAMWSNKARDVTWPHMHTHQAQLCWIYYWEMSRFCRLVWCWLSCHSETGSYDSLVVQLKRLMAWQCHDKKPWKQQDKIAWKLANIYSLLDSALQNDACLFHKLLWLKTTNLHETWLCFHIVTRNLMITSVSFLLNFPI